MPGFQNAEPRATNERRVVAVVAAGTGVARHRWAALSAQMSTHSHPPHVHGKCPCCSTELSVDARKPFGIVACPECERVLWWLLPSGQAQPVFSHRSLQDGADSLDVVELVLAMEKESGLKIPDEDASKFRSVEDVMDYLGRHRK